jgi:hypothetical protein
MGNSKNLEWLFVSDIMIEQHNIGGQSYIAPLYQYHHLEINGDYEKRANFTEDFSKFININNTLNINQVQKRY